VINHD